ncbi:MAG TPA: cytochrome c-type biogenesis protein CcmH [Leucothrix sp.]|nr:cytochrome c-type biogenesis protein CcmH [Leucothrix sp.]
MKTLLLRTVLALGLCFLSLQAQAVKIEFHSFENKQQEKLYLQLIAELRCVKCQNQNLAESNAELAMDMREKAYEMIVKGGSRQDVVKYMTDRYGDFVLYKPPFIAKTLMLWIGPAIFLILSLFFLLKLIKKQQKEPIEILSGTDRDSVRELLNSKKD